MLWHRGLSPPHCLSKEDTLNPRQFAGTGLPREAYSFHFGLLGLVFLSFWPFGPRFLSFWPFGPGFRCILAFWALISVHFGLLGQDFAAFWCCGPLKRRHTHSAYQGCLPSGKISKRQEQPLGPGVCGIPIAPAKVVAGHVFVCPRQAITLGLRQDKQKAGAAPGPRGCGIPIAPAKVVAGMFACSPARLLRWASGKISKRQEQPLGPGVAAYP